MLWGDLSDDELAARLIARDVEPATVADLVRWRDTVQAAEVISEVLD